MNPIVSMTIAAITAIAAITIFASPARAQGIDFTRAPAADWPKLEKVYHYGDITVCTAPLGITTIACATPDFPNGLCEMYFPAVVLRRVVLHEEAHCDGYDHYGDSIMHDAWTAYKKYLEERKAQ